MADKRGLLGYGFSGSAPKRRNTGAATSDAATHPEDYRNLPDPLSDAAVLTRRRQFKENLPSGKTDFEKKIEYARIGEERDKDDTQTVPNAIAIYHQLMMPNHQPLMVERLHEALAVERSMWSEEFASEFEDLGSEIVHQESEDDVEVVDDDVPEEEEEEISELERLLTVGA
jgi:hypothetical protein